MTSIGDVSNLHVHRRAWKWRRRVTLTSTVWLMLLWPLLYSDFSLVNLLAGLALALAVQVVLPLPHTGLGSHIRFTALIWLVVRFLWDMAAATVQVAGAVLRGRQPLNAIVRVQLTCDSDLFLTMLAGMMTLVPGSVVIQAYRRQSLVYLHVLDIEQAGGVGAVRRAVLAQEARILRALGSQAELAAAGVSPPVWWAPWRGKDLA